MANLLTLENLRITFPATRHQWQHEPSILAVDDLSLSLEQGEILGLVGESGAGKSLTGSALMDLVPSPGRINFSRFSFLGQDRKLQELAGLRGAEMGMIFQDPLSSLNPLRTIGDQLLETLQFHHPSFSRQQAEARAIELLEAVGIPAAAERFNAYPHAFSGGMRQRVVIALALAPEPSLLIADEPTTALDVSVQAQIMRLLRDLAVERGTAVILVTHDMGLIAQYTDRVAVMYAGRLVEQGPTQQVLTDPAHRYTRGLLASTPSLNAAAQGQLYAIPGAMPRIGRLPGGCAYHPRCDRAFAPCSDLRPELDALDAQRQVACHLHTHPDSPQQQKGEAL